jgi:hypothetical protein
MSDLILQAGWKRARLVWYFFKEPRTNVFFVFLLYQIKKFKDLLVLVIINSSGMSIPEQVMPGPIGQSIFHGVVLPMASKHLNDSFTGPSLQYVLK